MKFGIPDILLYLCTLVYVFIPLFWMKIAPAWSKSPTGKAMMYLFWTLAAVFLYIIFGRLLPAEAREPFRYIWYLILIGVGIRVIVMLYTMQWKNYVAAKKRAKETQ